MEAERKKAFLMYCDYKQHLELLSDEERGKLFIALLDYAESKKTPQLSGMAAMAFSFIKAQMDRDNVKYEERCAINRENGAKGGRPRKSQDLEQQEGNPTKPKITERFSGKPKKPDTDNDTENENENDNDTGNDTNHTGGSQSRRGVKGGSRSDELFDAFWESYPNKKAKQSALKAWKKIKPNAALFEKIMKAIELQKRSEDWKRENGRYIPHPASWLNAGRWDDEIKEVSNNGEAGQRSDSGGIVSPDFQSRKSGSGTPAGFKSESRRHYSC